MSKEKQEQMAAQSMGIEKDENGKLGVENIKKVMAFVLILGVKVDEVAEDGHVGLFEMLGFVPTVAQVGEVYKAVPDAFNEYKDLDSEEQAEIESWLVSEHNTDPGEVAEVVENVLLSLVYLQKVWLRKRAA